MASTKSVKLDETKFKEAVRLACNLLQVDGLYDGQEEALKQFFRGKNIFFSAHTGYGKSLIFQAIPIISDVLNDEVVRSSVVLVISPLISLMKDQVRNCNERLGISADLYQCFNTGFNKVKISEMKFSCLATVSIIILARFGTVYKFILFKFFNSICIENMLNYSI